MISVQALRKAYGTVLAADGVTLDVPNGVVTGLLGANGAGKTTTLRAIAGLISPDGGAAFVDGVDVARDPRGARRSLGVLPDASGCHGRLTVREHVAYSGALHGLTSRDVRARVDRWLEVFGLTTLANRAVGQLSSGEMRRVRLTSALVHDPANVILDEPTSGLDVMSARQLRSAIRRLAATGRAVLFSSHVMPEVAATCDRVAVLSTGRVVATGTPADLLAHTGSDTLEDAFVALVGGEAVRS